MIREISSFIEFLEKDNPNYFTENVPPGVGLHLILDIDAEGNVDETSLRSLYCDKNNDCYETIPGELGDLEYYCDIINTNKCFDLPAKKIHSSVPFAIKFKPSIVSNPFSESGFKELQSIIISRLPFFFQKTRALNQSIENIEKITENLENFCKAKLFQIIYAEADKREYLKKNDEINFTDGYIKVYFNPGIELYKAAYDKYIEENVYNVKDYNIDKDEYGLSDFLNTANQKKPFLIHQTSPIDIARIPKSIAKNLFKFLRLIGTKDNNGKRKIPNPLAIFIDNNQLTSEALKFYGKEGVANFHEILRELFKKQDMELGNYYLINWQMTKDGFLIYDFDYVEQFKYKIEKSKYDQELKIQNIFNLKGGDYKNNEIDIDNIFKFESFIVSKIFDNSLVTLSSGEVTRLKYFEEIKYDLKYFTHTTFQNIITYRKKFYDYIYKSRYDLLDWNVFKNIIRSQIIDYIKHDEYNASKKTHTHEWKIKELLNIYYGLLNYYKGRNMSQSISELQDSVRNIFNKESVEFDNDDQFLFGAGQAVFFIIKQSESANKSHAMVEPFINKSNLKLFKKEIANSFIKYKHKFNFRNGRFEKLMSAIMSYYPESGTLNIKEHLPEFLTGYFSDTLIYEKSENSNNEYINSNDGDLNG